MTIKTIAEIAGVSCSTVSRVLNNRGDVNKETRKRILQIIEESGFVPNAMARGFQSMKSNCIGIIVPQSMVYVLTNSFYGGILLGILNELQSRGYFMLFCNTKNTLELVNLYRQKRVDGFLMIRLEAKDSNIVGALSAEGIPYASTTTINGVDNMPIVDIDNFGAASKAVQYLVDCGHRHISTIMASNNLHNTQLRYSGYCDVLKRNGLRFDPRLVAHCEATLQGGHDAMLEILDNNVPFTGVFVYGDILAIGAMRALRERGLRIPDDVSVIGFDGIPESGYTDPPLTTVRQPFFEKGQAAARLLLDQMEFGKQAAPVTLDTRLVLRDSCRSI